MSGTGLTAGDIVEVEIGRPAHGGHCVARYEGQVLFVRHVLPGERARVQVTEVRARHARADAVEILTRAPQRVTPPCRWAGPGLCGGCDWQHTDPATQRRIKADIVVEQLVRLGGLSPAHPLAGHTLADLTVAEVPGARPDSTGWRTRVQFSVTSDGRLGLRAHRSSQVVQVDRCLLAVDGVDALDLPALRWPGWERVEAISSAGGDRALVLQPASPGPAPHLPTLPREVAVSGPGVRRGRGYVREQVPTATGPVPARVTGNGFWQVHPGAPAALLDAVLDQIAPQTGEHILDLYCGVGLFSLGLGPAVGPQGRVTAVEAAGQAVKDARRNLHALPQVQIVAGRVDRGVLGSLDRVDAVVLDPPRIGAGRDVVEALARLGPRAISYVACDPASLGRDTALLGERGYRLVDLRAFDLFPMTHHIECVALFTPTGPGLGDARSA